MFADRGVLRVCKIASAAAGWAILPGLLAVVLLSSSAAFADDPPWDRWWRVEKPSKEECDAAREWDKATDAWIDLCGEGRDKQSAPKAPPMEQQLAAEAEKRCIEENAKDRDAYEACLTNARLAIFPAAAAENRCIENVKDHEAYEACLTNVRLKIILANSPAIQAQCSGRTGDDLIDCVDLIYVYGGRLKDMLAANLKQVSLKEWGKQVEEEWQARKADPERRKQSGSQCGGPGGAGQRWQVNGNELHGCPCGYGLKPTPGAFGAWSCQKLGTILLAPDKTDNPQDDSPDSGGSGSPSGNDPAANTDAPPINRFDVRVPEKSAPSVSLPGASPTNRPTVPVPGAPRANTPTATAAPPRGPAYQRV